MSKLSDWARSLTPPEYDLPYHDTQGGAVQDPLPGLETPHADDPPCPMPPLPRSTPLGAWSGGMRVRGRGSPEEPE